MENTCAWLNILKTGKMNICLSAIRLIGLAYVGKSDSDEIIFERFKAIQDNILLYNRVTSKKSHRALWPVVCVRVAFYGGRWYLVSFKGRRWGGGCSFVLNQPR